jgi:SAM-dependent methyltransferase
MHAEFYDVLAASQSEHWWYSARREILRWAVGEALIGTPSGLLYDLGCGVGANLPLLGEFGATVGVDASPIAIAHCRDRGLHNVRQADLERLTGIESGSGRAVLLADVIEHLDDDRACLRAVHDVLGPRGAVVITVPAFEALWGPNDDVSQHRRRYTRASLVRALGDRFRVERLTYFNSLLLPPVAIGRWAQRLYGAQGGAEGRFPPDVVNRALRAIFRAELPLLRRGVNLPAGVSLLCIARR